MGQTCSSSGIQNHWSICPQLDAQEEIAQCDKIAKHSDSLESEILRLE